LTSILVDYNKDYNIITTPTCQAFVFFAIRGIDVLGAPINENIEVQPYFYVIDSI